MLAGKKKKKGSEKLMLRQNSGTPGWWDIPVALLGGCGSAVRHLLTLCGPPQYPKE